MAKTTKTTALPDPIAAAYEANKNKPLRYVRWAERHEDGSLYPHSSIVRAATDGEARRQARAEAATRGHHQVFYLHVAPAGSKAEAEMRQEKLHHYRPDVYPAPAPAKA